MSERRRLGWSRLDNAAKIFPSTRNGTNTCVFRFSCELLEDIDAGILQSAANAAIADFPGFQCVMKRGVFWYYLEQCNLMPMVCEEKKAVCSPIYEEGERKLLFEISYYQKRINLEVYHVLTDGTGAMHFLRNIVYHYLKLAHKEEFDFETLVFDHDASLTQRASDGFKKYYQKTRKTKRLYLRHAYNINFKKHDDERLQIIEGIASVKKVIDAAHQYNTTMTVFLAALLMDSIHKEMSLQSKKNPIVLMIPVNLRQYFPSETTKNFFGMIGVPYDFKSRSGEFSDIISVTNDIFKQELTAERLAVRMNSLAALEYNPLIRVVPLPLKNLILRRVRKINNRRETAVMSNVGRVTMPELMKPYIQRFSMIASTLRLQLCLCSFEDSLQIVFSSSFISTDIQKHFFRSLSNYGVDVEIRCNDFYQKEGR